MPKPPPVMSDADALKKAKQILGPRGNIGSVYSQVLGGWNRQILLEIPEREETLVMGVGFTKWENAFLATAKTLTTIPNLELNPRELMFEFTYYLPLDKERFTMGQAQLKKLDVINDIKCLFMEIVINDKLMYTNLLLYHVAADLPLTFWDAFATSVVPLKVKLA